MTFYQELQLNQAGSKSLLKNSKTMKEKLYHAFVYMVKIAVTMVFCFAFVTASSIILGKDNSIVGVVVLLCVMVFRNADLGIHTRHSTWLLALFFVIMTVCPHLANQLSPLPALLINIAALAVLILFGCHNPFMFNQSTLVLGYLLLYGYDVSGKSYMLRIAGMAAGAVLTCLVFYRNHKNRVFKRNMKAVIQEFDLFSSRTKWQLCQILCVPLVLVLHSFAICRVQCGQVLQPCLPSCRLWRICSTESEKGLSVISPVLYASRHYTSCFHHQSMRT